MSEPCKEAFVTRKEFQLYKELMDERAKALREALAKADESQRSYNERTNEIRGAMADQGRLMLTREEYGIRHKTLEDRIQNLETFRSTTEGRREQVVQSKTQSHWGIEQIIAILALIALLLSVFWKAHP